MALTDTRYGFWPVDAGKATIRTFPEAAAESFVAGDAVLMSSGSVSIGLAASTELCGVAAEPATGVTGNLIGVYCDSEQHFEGRGDAADSLVSADATDIIGAAGAMMLDGDGGSTDIAIVIKASDPGETDGAGKRFVFKIVKHQFADISS